MAKESKSKYLSDHRTTDDLEFMSDQESTRSDLGLCGELLGIGFPANGILRDVEVRI